MESLWTTYRYLSESPTEHIFCPSCSDPTNQKGSWIREQNAEGEKNPVASLTAYKDHHRAKDCQYAKYNLLY